MKSFLIMFFSILIATPAFSARTLCSFYSTLPSDYEEYDGSPRAAVDRIFYNISPWDNYPDESFSDYEETDPNGCPSYGITTNSAPEFIYSDENYNFLFRARGFEGRYWKRNNNRCIQVALDINNTAGVKVVNDQSYLDGEGIVCITSFPKNESRDNAPPLDKWKIPKINNNDESCKPDLYTPNPTFLPTGEKFLVETDFDDLSPHPLNLKRYYLSGRPNSERWLGKWRHSFDENLEHYGPTSTGKEFIVIHLASEGAVYFHKENSQWINSSTGGKESLILSENQWVFTEKNGVQRVFLKNGQISSQTDINGWSYKYSYSSNGDLIRVTNNFDRSLEFKRDLSNNNKWNVFLNNQHITSYYSDNGQLERVDYLDGTYKSYGYMNSLEEVWDESGVQAASYSYDEAGRVISTELAGGVNNYQISYPGNFASTAVVTDPLGKIRTYNFGGADNIDVTAATAPSSTFRRFTTSATLNFQGLPISKYDAKGNRNTYSWDTNRDLLLKTTEAKDSEVERFTENLWHPQWRLPVTIAESGRTTNFTYDNFANLLSKTVTDTATGTARVTRWTYYPSGLVATEAAPNGAVTSYQYDNAGNLTSVINPLGHIEKFTHDATGRVLTYTSATGLVMAYSYDARGRLITLNRGGLLTTFTYHPSGKLATVTMPYGYVMTYSYDTAHRLTNWSDNRGVTGSYILDPMGNRLNEEVRNSHGQMAWKLVRSINSLNRVSSIQVGSGGAPITYTYDSNGDLSHANQTLTGIQNVTTLNLDALRRIKGLQDANNSNATLAYNALDDITQASDFNGVSSIYSPDAFSNVGSEASPDIGNISTDYGALGLPQKVTDAMGRATTVIRDALGRPTQLLYADSSSTQLRYDLPGASYNAPGAPQASMGYLSEIQDQNVITTFQYDKLGNITRKSQTLMANGDTRAVAYSYYSHGGIGAGLLQTVTYSSGKQLAHAYNSTGQLTALHWDGQPLVTDITWSPLGEPTGWQWPSFVSSTSSLALAEQRTYTDAGRLASSTLFDLNWDGAGRIGNITQQHMLPSSTITGIAQVVGLSSVYRYDRLGRLTASAHSALPSLALPVGWSLSDVIGPTSIGYAYDANGNRTQAFYGITTLNGTATLQRNVQTTSGSNRISGYTQLYKPADSSTSQTTTVSYQQDASGALTKKGDNHLHQSVQGRISKVSLYADPSHALAVDYTYNVLNQRLLKSDARLTAAPVTEHAMYADDGIGSTLLGLYSNWRSTNSAAPVGELNNSEIIYLPTASGPMPIAAEINGRLYAVNTDHLNTPRRLTNQQGQVAWQWLISGFGEVQPTYGAKGYALNGIDNGKVYSEAVNFTLRYPGQQWDEETELNYNLNRYYDSQSGRYIQSDPIGLQGGWNRFAYVGGNPLNFVDPDGLNPLSGAINGGRLGATGGSAFGPVGTAIGGVGGALVGAGIGWYITGPMWIKPPDNAYAPNGPKAPGKPGEADGFKDPKGGENWVPNPNPGRGGSGYGWQDANGDVWCPTGQGGRAHGDPHWDIQSPGGGYRNKRPQR